jgi:predicted DNA-binding transcriptional regulator AlpA
MTVTQKDYASAVSNHEPLFKPDKAGEYVGFTSNWLAKLRVYGGGPKYIRLGRRIRYAPSDLDAWIAAGRSVSTSRQKTA